MKKDIKTALILEGGAMRGIYTAGVLDTLLENNIHVECVVGVSAGAIHGCSYVSEQYERSIRYYKSCRKDYRFMSFKSFFKTGNVVDTDYCYDEIPNKLFPFDHEAFEKSKTKFYATVTNLETGEAEYINLKTLRGNKIDYLRASASMPVVSQIVEIDGNKYLDGAIADSIPIKKFIEMGYDRCIVVKTKPHSYKKKKEKVLAISKRLYKDYPKFVEKVNNRHNMYNETIDYIESLEKDKKIIVIEPSTNLKIGRMEKKMETIIAAYELGKKDTNNKLREIKKFLKK